MTASHPYINGWPFFICQGQKGFLFFDNFTLARHYSKIRRKQIYQYIFASISVQFPLENKDNIAVSTSHGRILVICFL
jgi:hypothetical protein